MGIKVGGIELFMGPTVLGGPDDLDEVVRSFIGRAERSLAIAVEELDSRPVAEAIQGRQSRQTPGPADPRGATWSNLGRWVTSGQSPVTTRSTG